MKTRWVLGLNKYDHDVSAVLLKDGVPFVGVAKERITRVKYDGGLADVAIGYCLKTAGLRFDDLDLVVQNTYALAIPELEHDLLTRTHGLHLPDDERELIHRSPLFRNPKAVNISHHLAHAYSAFAVSPFDEGAVMVVDGIGSHRRDVSEPVPPGDEGHPADRESESYYAFRGTELTCVRKAWLPVVPTILNGDFTKMPGLGAMYSRVAEYVFDHWNKCGEVMGLAPFGHARADLPPILGVKDGQVWTQRWWPDWLSHPWVETGIPGAPDWQSSPHLRDWQDLCFRVQQDLEDALLERARELHRVTGMKNLVIAGGVALNCVANGRIARETLFENVWVQPAAGDTGISIGCAMYGELAVLKQPRRHVMRTDFLGRTHPDDEIDEALAEAPWNRFISVTRSSDVAADVARALADGKVVGWLQGGAELGPRALGHRSILSDPRSIAAKERLNARVKHRQAFRPFAPAVTIEKVDEWFEKGPPSPHMLMVRRVRSDRAAQIPAVVHVDGTARLQTVDRADDPLFHSLLCAFEGITGVPVLVNTSFNVRGEPIVETPLDALLCFVQTDMDLLVIHDRLVVKSRFFQPMRRFLLEYWRAKNAESVGSLMKSTVRRYVGN
ncbi:MAG: carbamoyltransferase [Planctomycetes bacterium]|nr:carbamoyltransferase [Planctomycetota bacterium]